ncbi:HK97 family phage prohead protease [Aestuariimicrobium sp. Y1814]|uniref:HK97 family phage prohead protease n=1 Tax=Aestuariimicrobium sp. Y1814 TaxID=3418742 RepID=UPI003DA6DE3B
MTRYRDFYPINPRGDRPLSPSEPRYADLVNTGAQHRRYTTGTQHRGFTATLRTATDTKTSTMTGIAVPYDEWSQVAPGVMERFLPSAFTDLIRAQTPLPLLVAHDYQALPIGISTGWAHAATRATTGLQGSWRIDHKDPAAADAYRKVEEGYATGLSVGFQSPLEDQDVTFDDNDTIWITRRANVRLLEVSIVSAPAYPGAQITHVG